MRDVTMEASGRRRWRLIWRRFWTYFVVNSFHTKLFSHVIFGTFRRWTTNHLSVVAVTPSQPWSIYRLSMGCHTVSPAPVWVRMLGLYTRVRGVAEYPSGGMPGSIRILGQVAQFWQNILNLYYSTCSWKLFWYRSAFCVRGRQCE